MRQREFLNSIGPLFLNSIAGSQAKSIPNDNRHGVTNDKFRALQNFPQMKQLGSQNSVPTQKRWLRWVCVTFSRLPDFNGMSCVIFTQNGSIRQEIRGTWDWGKMLRDFYTSREPFTRVEIRGTWDVYTSRKTLHENLRHESRGNTREKTLHEGTSTRHESKDVTR